jgi:DNA-binding NtrC family response regulator
MSICRPL